MRVVPFRPLAPSVRVLALLALFTTAAIAAVPAGSPVPAKTFKNTGGAGNYFTPVGIALLPDGGFVVVDRELHRATIESSQGDLIRVLGNGFGTTPGQFVNPGAAAVLTSGDILIADTDNSRLQRFSQTGTLLQIVGGPGSGTAQLQHPTGIAAAADGGYYVADQWNHRIVQFNAQGDLVRHWGTSGNGPGAFLFPSQVALDSRGNVYVTDLGNSRVEKFSPSGVFLRTWGSAGTGTGQFNGPVGLAIDDLDHVYVAETGSDRIQRFSPDGTWQLTFGTHGTGSGQLNGPGQIACGSQGELWIANTLNRAIERFSPLPLSTVQGQAAVPTDQWNMASDPRAFVADVAAGDNGDAFVIEYEKGQQVTHLGPGGQILGQWPSVQPGVSGSGGGPILDYRNGKVYVVDNSNDVFGTQLDRVLVFSTDGTLIRTISAPGTSNGRVQDPMNVAVDATGVVHILNDVNAPRIDRFDGSGTFLSRIPVSSSQTSLSLTPSGGVWTAASSFLDQYSSSGVRLSHLPITVPASDQGVFSFDVSPDRGAFVLSWSQNRLRHYGFDGTLIDTLDLGILNPGLSPQPWNIDVDERGDLLIVDLGQRTVRRYSTAARITSIVDRPADEGGAVRLSFTRASLDDPTLATHVFGYLILRRLDGALPPSPQIAPGLPDYEIVATVNATGAASYVVDAPTFEDATTGSRMLSTYIVRALTTPFHVLDSHPVTGWSIDNLPPLPPSSLAGDVLATSRALRWRAVANATGGYRVYRGPSAGFELNDTMLLGATPDTSLIDTEPLSNTNHYAVTALDAAGHESAPARLAPGELVGVPEAGPAAAFAIRDVFPNPARGARWTVDVSLVGKAPVQLELVDASGRRVLSRDLGIPAEGRHRVELTPERPVAPGLYWLRLHSRDHSDVHRIAVVR